MEHSARHMIRYIGSWAIVRSGTLVIGPFCSRRALVEGSIPTAWANTVPGPDRPEERTYEVCRASLWIVVFLFGLGF